ncbi:MAG: hypothetical protein ACYC5Y_13565 [Symbiobacteriia bacterium]
MNVNGGFALAAAVVGVVFAGMVGRQFLERRKPHQFLWTLAMVMFAGASFAQFYAELLGGWTPGLFRLYYLLASSLVVTMGAGTVYLLRQNGFGQFFVGVLLFLPVAFLHASWQPALHLGTGLYWGLGLALSIGLPMLLHYLGFKTSGHTFMALVLVLGVVFAYQLWTHPLNNGLLGDVVKAAGGKGVVGDAARPYFIVFSIAGAVALFLGAVYSWWVTRHWYNLIIALGTLIFSAGGSLAATGFPFLLHLSEMLGGAVLLYGFIKSREVGARKPAPAAARASN